MNRADIDARADELKQMCLADRVNFLRQREEVCDKLYTLQTALKEHYRTDNDVFLGDEDLAAAEEGVGLSTEVLNAIDNRLHTINTALRDIDDIQQGKVVPMVKRTILSLRAKVLITIVTFVVTLLILL